MQNTERKKNCQESERLIEMENYFPRADFWMKTHTLWALHLCEALPNPHVLTHVPSFPQSYFAWCHYWNNTFVSRQQWSTCAKMLFGNHYKSFSHLTCMPNEANLPVKSKGIWLFAWNSIYITLHNMMIFRSIKAIFK